MATAASIAAVQKAYVAYYGRPADPSGLEYWANRVDNEGGIDALIGQFGTSAEAATRFGSLSQSDAIDALYQQIFGRAPEAAGKAFYLNGLLRGDYTLVTIAQNVIDGATGSDATIVANKLSAAQSWTDALDTPAEAAAYSGDNAAGNARNWLKTVDSTESSVTSAVAGIDAAVSTLGNTPSNPGTSFTLTSTAAGDTLTGTSLDDVFDATGTGTLQSADTLLDSSTSDNDTLNANVSANDLAPKLTNIETVNVTGKFLTTGLALTNVSGVKNLNLDSNLAGGTATVTNSNALNAASINVGDNVTSLRVTSLASGTRDSVGVQLGTASGTFTLTDTGADLYAVTVGAGATVNMVSAGASDVITLANEGSSATIRSSDSSGSALASLVVNANGDFTLNSVGGFGSGVTVNGDGIVTLKHSGNSTPLDGIVLGRSGEGTVVLDIGTLSAATNLGGANVDTVRISASGAAATTLLLKEGSTLELANNFASTNLLTVGVGTVAAAIADAGGTVMINLDYASVGSIAIASSANSLLISNTTGGVTGNVVSLTTFTSMEAIQIVGENAVRFDQLVANDGTVVSAADLAGRLTLSATDSLTVYGGVNNDTLTLTGTSTVYGGDGDDTLSGITAVPQTFNGGAGNDTIIFGGGASGDTATGGDGADIFRATVAATEARSTISDFVVGTDVLQLKGVTAIDVSNISNASGIYNFGVGSMTLTGNTASDLSSSVQLGWSNANAVDLSAASAATVVAGSLNDFIIVNQGSTTTTVTTGGGSDTLLINLSDAGYTAITSTTITDFVVGTDKLVIYGSADDTVASFDSFSVQPSSGVFSFLGSASITLNNGGSALTGKDLSDSIQLGWSGSASNWLMVSATAAITLGDFNDFLNVAVSSTLTIKDGGGVDTIYGSSTVIMNYGALTGIDTGESYRSSDATKVTDAVSGNTYIFQKSEDGAGTSTLEFTGGVSGGAVSLANVAAWLDLQLGVSSGEKYVAIINDHSTTSAAAFYVNVVGDLDADDITLITLFDMNIDASNVANT